MNFEEGPVRRTYRSQVREDNARRTKELIAVAAMQLFVSHGYVESSVAQIARRAGVAAQTVYNAFGTKADLLKYVYDITLVGDDEPIPFAQRPEVIELYSRTDPRAFLSGYAAAGLNLLNRLGPLMKVIRAGALAGDPDLEAHLEKAGQERLIGASMAIRHLIGLAELAPNVTADQARDAVWTLNSVEVWELLTRNCGWSDEQYVSWIGRAMADAVLGPVNPSGTTAG